MKEIGKGERIALAKLAVDHLERTQRPLRIAIDAAIWNFQTQSGQGGKNPALRTLYYRLLKLLALPIHPLFVYDGKNKPLIKRGRAVSRWGTCIANETSKKLVQQFKFPCHVAPGEAEAECALLQKRGIVDMVMSQDGDAIMFGSRQTLRDWSKEGTRGNKTPTHVNLLDLPRLKERSGLDPEGMILVALLSGGDYDQNGVAGFGSTLACEAARACFGSDLLELVRNDDATGLQEWRERLQYELETNKSGYFKRRYKTVKVPDTFPDRTIVGYYVNPAVSKDDDLAKLERKISKTWDESIDIVEMRHYVGETFDWLYKPGAWKLVRTMAPSLLAQQLRRGFAQQYVTTVDQIKERRQHFTTGGIPELRVSAVPADVVGLDLDAEEDSPEFLARLADEQEQDDVENGAPASGEVEENEELRSSQEPRKQRKSPLWNPNDPEKVWIPETVVQLGVPALVEEWQQNERDKLADPKKFATRKCKKASKKTTATSQTGGIGQYFAVSKVTTIDRDVQNDNELLSRRKQRTKFTQPPPTPTKKPVATSLSPNSPNIKQFFKMTKPLPGPLSLTAEQIKATKIARKHTITPDSEQSATERPVSAEMTLRNKSGSRADPVTIMSSPPPGQKRSDAHSFPSTPVRGRSTDLSANPDDLPDSVTRRKRRGKKSKPSSRLEQSGKAMTSSKTLESFFHSDNDDVEGSAAATKGGSLVPEVPPEHSTGLQVDFMRKKIHAVPRESLPGTWRDVDLDEEVMSIKTKRTTRVSYVDLIDA